MRLEVSADAQADLRGIAAYIARDNPARAIGFVEELIETMWQAAERPLSFPARDDWRPGLRAARHGSYHIVFRVTGDLVEIVRVLHGARDIESLF